MSYLAIPSYAVPAGVVVLLLAGFFLLLHHRRLKLRPPWASFFTPWQWEQFVVAIAKELHARQIPFQYDPEGIFSVKVDDTEMQMGLGNLAQICHQAGDRTLWTGIIKTHLDQILDAPNDHVEEMLRDFDNVKDQLFIRLMTLEGMPRQDLAVARNDIPGTIAYLAVDLPTTVRSITTGEVDGWDKTPGQLYEIGLNNVRTKSAIQEARIPVQEGIEFIGVTGDDFFVASHTLLLHEHPDWMGRYGSLVIIPTRQSFVVFPINDLLFTKAMQYLAMMATGLEQEGPGSITNNVFWYNDGSYVDIPYKIESKTVSVTPPADFVAMMNRIAEEQGAPAGEG
ncbi:MAG: DUF1444 domain-containing protein [Armatimonadota bacterium]